MWPATLPMMLLLIELMTLLRSAPPTTTRKVPPRITAPIRRLIRERNRLRAAILSRMPRRPTSVPSGHGDGGAGELAPDDLPVGEPDHRVCVGHHPRVVRGEDEGGAVALVHLLHQVDDPLAGLRVEVRGGLVGQDD